MVTRNQFITAGMGQAIDINIQSVIDAMRIYPEVIRNPWGCLHKVQAAFQHFKPKNENES